MLETKTKITVADDPPHIFFLFPYLSHIYTYIFFFLFSYFHITLLIQHVSYYVIINLSEYFDKVYIYIYIYKPFISHFHFISFPSFVIILCIIYFLIIFIYFLIHYTNKQTNKQISITHLIL